MGYIKSKLKYLWNNYNHVVILSYYGVLYFLYIIFEKNIVPKYFMHSFLDDYIPFVKYFVVPYLLWYPYIVLPMVFFGLRARKDFLRLSIFMFGGMTLCYVFYFLFPNGQNLRPQIAGDDIFTRTILHLWSVDTSTNVAPSMHVLDSIAVHLAIIKSEKLKDKKWLCWISLVMAVLICLSTVFIKQHSIEDAIYAGILSYGLYLVIYRFELLQKILTKVQSLRKPKNIFEEEAVPTSSKI